MQQVEKLRDQSLEELQTHSEDLAKEIFMLKNEFRMTRKMEKPHLFKQKKRERARVLTIIREKQ